MRDRIVPLSVRTSTDPAVHEQWNVLHEGIPEHLKASVYRWVSNVVREFPNLAAECQRTLQLPMIDSNFGTALSNALRTGDEHALDVIDALLQLLYRTNGSNYADRRDQERCAEMTADMIRYLKDGNSAWEVELVPFWHLQRVVDETTTAAFKTAADETTDAGRLLAEAWYSTFKREPDYANGYWKSVLAVESVATQEFIPKDTHPTLGKAIANLRSTTSRWTVADLDDKDQSSSDTLLAMLQTMWQNHQRHSMQNGVAPQNATREETEAVLFLAITIVQWFHRGFVQKKPTL